MIETEGGSRSKSTGIFVSEKKVLAGLDWAPFKKSSNDQLLPIRQMAVNKAIFKIKGDSKMSEADKNAKIAELQKKFDELGKQIAALSN